jgi:hypothetical protein
MQLPFVYHKVRGQRTWIQRVTRRGRPDMAKPMISNLLAEKPPGQIDPNAIAAIATETGLSGTQLRRVAFELYRDALAAFVADNELTMDEVAYLQELRKALTLSNEETLKAEHEVIHPRYAQALGDVLANGEITPDERNRLGSLQIALQLDSTTVEEMRSPRTRELMNAKLESVLSDRRVSPYEQQQLEEMAQNLGVPMTLSEAQRSDRELFALFWQIENGPMPWYAVSIVLQKGERCHFASACEWYEFRTKTVRANYSGPTYRIKIAKGLYYRVGSIKVTPIKQEELTRIDSGMVYFTNKRIIFDGQRGNKAIRLTALIGIEPYSDGIGLEKATGKSPILVMHEHVELASVVLSALLVQSQ